MSFTREIKDEICLLKGTQTENIAELSGFFRNNAYIKNIISVTSENPKIIRRIYILMRETYNINLLVNKQPFKNFKNKNFYEMIISNKIDLIVTDLNLKNKIKDYIIDDEDAKRAYLRGCFLAKGSINDPKTSRYHLELMFEKKTEAYLVKKILVSFYINSKIIKRDKGYMLYVKEAEKISDFLRLIGANSAVLYFEDIRIYRDHKNMTNRLNNCEQANMEKTIATCNKQLNDIDSLLKYIDFELLDDKLQEVIIYRQKYKEASLSELGSIISLETGKKITKSGLSHRFKKISDMVLNLNIK